MKHELHRLTAGTFAFALTLGRIASADCNPPYVPSDEALLARIGSSEAVVEHQALYQNGYYKMLSDFGWSDVEGRADEFTTHFYGSFLVRHGVVSRSPPLRKNVNGAWEYDLNAIVLNPTFHRSWDDYAMLSYDARTHAYREVDPASGAPKLSRQSLFGYLELFGSGTGTGIVDLFPDAPTAGAWWRSIWDAFKDPDSLLEYNCKAFDHHRGFVFMAQLIVHENWHDTHAPNHTQGGVCTSGELECDTYIWGAPTSSHEYNALSRLQYMGVGAYQVDQRFMCDLVEAPADWIPLQTQRVANEQFNSSAGRSRFVNVGDLDNNEETPTGILPYSCGLPESILKVQPDGQSFCPDTTQLRCNTYADCGAKRPFYYWSCIEGCCTEFLEPT